MAEQALRFDLEEHNPNSLCSILRWFPLLETDTAQVIRRLRLLTLEKRLADTLGDKDLRSAAMLNLAGYHLDRGNLGDCHSYLEACRVDFDAKKMIPSLQAWFARLEVMLARRDDRLSTALVVESLRVVRAIGRVMEERLILEEVAGWHRDRGAHSDALATFNDLIALANTTSARAFVPVYQARRVQSLVALGRTDEARPIVLKFEKDVKVPNVLSAVHYLALGDHRKAWEHALGAYKGWWGDGPPYHHHWPLEDCRRVLAALGRPEPALPSFDPSTVEPFDFEAESSALSRRYSLRRLPGERKRPRMK
jgi:hypothetical protein